MKQRRWGAVLVVAVMLVLAARTASAASPKYVFFFLGDGMASAQIQATEAYLATRYAVDQGLPVGPSAGELNAAHLLKPENRLHMSRMPVVGMQTTYSAFALQTDSASAATAFACGLKTRSGVIGMDDAKTRSYKSIAQLAHEQGRKVAILSSASLDHATPAAYYASVANRNDMNAIASQLAATGYEFFGGGGLAAPTAPKTESDTHNDVWQRLKDNGYSVLKERGGILALKEKPTERVVCINPVLDGSAAMPFAIDKPDGNLTLAEMTDVAIETLYNGQNGGNSFFIMVEGGKIDWACHANDAMTAIDDIIDLDNAVDRALAFYGRHPEETLIVVTGDHETGGMSVGHATTGYKARYDRLLGQKKSFDGFQASEWAEHKAANAPACPRVGAAGSLAGNTEMLDLMGSVFGLRWADLNIYQKEKLEDAYAKSLCGTSDNSEAENALLYGGNEPIVVTITHILNELAGIGWTSYVHTGVPVPVFAQGQEAGVFAGFYDNTDIAKKLAKVMNISEALPVPK